MTTKVKLRKKPISKNRHSLYLDFYPPIPHPKTGKPTRREFLGLYLFDKPKTPFDKVHNKETLQIAESIRQKKDNHLNKPEIYSAFEKEQLRLKEMGEQNFIDYFKLLIDKLNGSNKSSWISTLKYLEVFVTQRNQDTIKFAELNEKFCNDFKYYLLNTKSYRSDKLKLSQNSAYSYFNKFKSSLKQAYKDGYLQKDLNSKIESIKVVETRREYLSLEELNRLVDTPCNYQLLKRAALFSALTGLRFSDIQKLLWSEIEYIKGDGYYINFEQKKTKNIETLPISEQAYNLLEPKNKLQSNKVFEGLKYSAYHNRHLHQWIGAAGITKAITFHCFRHTYATLQLANGTDIYTVSKMLGHRELKTTQIYAKIIDKTKREAVDRIKLKL